MEARGAQTATGQVLPETRTLHAVDSTWELAHTASPHQPPPDPQTHWHLLCASQQAWGWGQSTGQWSRGSPGRELSPEALTVQSPLGPGWLSREMMLAGDRLGGGRGWARGRGWLGAGGEWNACWTQDFQGRHCLVLAVKGLQVQPGT